MAEHFFKIEPDSVDDARRARVAEVLKMVKDDREHWDYAFKRMRKWKNFARGKQWPGSKPEDMSDPDRNYVANITLRHLKQRTASIYAKNPTFIWRRKRRLNMRFWDGTAQQLQFAMQMVDAGMDPTGMQMSIIQDAMASRTESQKNDRIGETLTGLYSYFIAEQIPPTKKMAKKQVFTSLTCGVAYFKQTFQRATDYPADVTRQLSDHMAQLQHLERLSEDLSAGEFTAEDAQADELRSLIQQLEQTEQIVLREGIALDYPDSTSIIPDQNLTYLPGFVGCGHVTEEYSLTVNQIKEVYRVDVSDHHTAYHETKDDDARMTERPERETCRVWEVWDRASNSMYVVCDGYFDYLVEPHAPVTYTERFYPWFVYAPNATDDSDDPFPPSDVELIMSQQMEINRAGEGLREHRFAARPGHVTASNITTKDGASIRGRKAHDVLTLQGLSEGEDIRQKLMPFPTNPIDPNLYATGPAFTDILRTVGTQEANLGGASGATATETSIAESSRQSTLESAIDEFDDLLTEMARAGGQILLQEMSPEKVAEIVGPGAVWPEMAADEVAKEIYLEVEAGSSGRPNRAQEVQVTERIAPLLFQMPGLKHEWLLRRMLKILDDGINYEDAVDMDALPIVAMNGMMQANANKGGMQEGKGGSNNASAPPEPGPAGPPVPGQAGFASETP
jgi:hypothetical protein